MTHPDQFEEPPEAALLDGAAGPVVRPYAVTRGSDRSDTRDRFDLLTFITAIPMADPGSVRLLPEHRALLAQCREPISVDELA